MAGKWLVSRSTGNVVAARCGTLGCPDCVLPEARRRSLAIAYSRPQRAILLTQVGDTWPVVQGRVNRLRYDVLEATGGKPFEWVWHVEPNPEGTGHHVHAWQHGSFVPQALLSDLADGVGMGGVVFINRVRSAVGASHYGLKGLGYGLKSVEEGQAATYLAENGARLTHQSRGYFRGPSGTLPLRTVEDLALSATRERDPGPWRMVEVRPR